MVDFDNKIIRYFDSGRYTNGAMYLRAMEEWLQKEWRASQQGEFPSGWGRLETTRDTPKQKSNCDCGLFLAFSANYLSVGAPLDFSQDDMAHLRRRMTIDILHAKIYEGPPAKQKSVTWAPQLEPAAEASSKPSKKRAAPPRRKPAAKKRAGGGASKMNCKKRDPYLDYHANRIIRYDDIIDMVGDEYDETDSERHELTPEHDYMTANELDILFGYMDSQNRVFCKEAGDGHCTLAGPERMRLWCADELESAWQPLSSDWYVPVRRYLAGSLQEDSVMFKSIYENVKYLHGNGIVDDTLDAHQLYDDLKRISPSVASEEAMRDKAEFEYYCGAWELMALVGRVPGRIFVIYKGSLEDCDCFQKDGDGVEVTREIDIRDAELDDTDTVLLYNGEDHYDSFVPYEGVVMPPVNTD